MRESFELDGYNVDVDVNGRLHVKRLGLHHYESEEALSRAIRLKRGRKDTMRDVDKRIFDALLAQYAQ